MIEAKAGKRARQGPIEELSQERGRQKTCLAHQDMIGSGSPETRAAVVAWSGFEV